MGRALTRIISETKGAVLAGALEAPGSELLGKDAGMLAGLPPNGVKLSADLWNLSAEADGILDFTVPGATIANVAIAAQRGLVHVIGTTGLSPSDDAVIKSVTSRAVVRFRKALDRPPGNFAALVLVLAFLTGLIWYLLKPATSPSGASTAATPPASPAFVEMLVKRDWVAYEPIGYDPTKPESDSNRLSEVEIRKDLQQLRLFGFSGIITFHSRGTPIGTLLVMNTWSATMRQRPTAVVVPP